ncbi:hypothetical protein Agub_g12556, partial [Astrephomene gubernaculifera]
MRSSTDLSLAPLERRLNANKHNQSSGARVADTSPLRGTSFAAGGGHRGGPFPPVPRPIATASPYVMTAPRRLPPSGQITESLRAAPEPPTLASLPRLDSISAILSGGGSGGGIDRVGAAAGGGGGGGGAAGGGGGGASSHRHSPTPTATATQPGGGTAGTRAGPSGNPLGGAQAPRGGRSSAPPRSPRESHHGCTGPGGLGAGGGG